MFQNENPCRPQNLFMFFLCTLFWTHRSTEVPSTGCSVEGDSFLDAELSLAGDVQARSVLSTSVLAHCCCIALLLTGTRLLMHTKPSLLALWYVEMALTALVTLLLSIRDSRPFTVKAQKVRPAISSSISPGRGSKTLIAPQRKHRRFNRVQPPGCLILQTKWITNSFAWGLMNCCMQKLAIWALFQYIPLLCLELSIFTAQLWLCSFGELYFVPRQEVLGLGSAERCSEKMLNAEIGISAQRKVQTRLRIRLRSGCLHSERRSKALRRTNSHDWEFGRQG